ISCGQPRIGQPLATDRFDHRIQPLKAVPFDVAFVQPKGELVQIAAKMLAAHAVVNAVVAAFQDCPDALNRVRVGRASRILASRVIDRIVTVEQPVQPGEHQVLISIELRPEFDVVMDALRCLLQTALWHRGRESSACAALPHSQNGSLAHGAAPSLELLVLVLVALLAADEALVQFHDALELRQFRPTASLSEPVEHKPCRLLSDANLLRQLQARDTLPCGYEQVHRVEPFVQRNVAPLEDRACADREIEGAGIAAIKANLGLLANALMALALRAERAVRPEPRFQVQSRRLRRRKHLEKLKDADCAFAHKNLLSALSDMHHIPDLVGDGFGGITRKQFDEMLNHFIRDKFINFHISEELANSFNCALAHRSPFFSSFKTMEIGLDCINRDHIMLSRNIRPVTPITRRLSTDKTQFFSILVICLLLIPKPIPEVFTGELIFYGLRDFILVLPCGHVFLAGFDAAQLEKIAVHSDGVIVEKSRVPVESVSQSDLHNASKTVSMVR